MVETRAKNYGDIQPRMPTRRKRSISEAEAKPEQEPEQQQKGEESSSVSSTTTTLTEEESNNKVEEEPPREETPKKQKLFSTEKFKYQYTNPELRESLQDSILRGTAYGNSGKWTSEKQKLLDLKYYQEGGRYLDLRRNERVKAMVEERDEQIQEAFKHEEEEKEEKEEKETYETAHVEHPVHEELEHELTVADLTDEELMTIHYGLHSSHEPKVITLRDIDFPVRISTTGCRYLRLRSTNIMEQNPKRESKFGKMAREGKRISWIIHSGRWGLIIDDHLIRH